MPVGTVATLPEKLDGAYGFKVFVMKKEEDYVMKLMTTCGSSVEVDDGRTQRCITEGGRKVAKRFKYHESFLIISSIGIKLTTRTISAARS